MMQYEKTKMPSTFPYINPPMRSGPLERKRQQLHISKHPWSSASESYRNFCSPWFSPSPPTVMSASNLFQLTTHSEQKVSKFTLPSLLKSCASRLDVNQGKRIHAVILQFGLQSDPYVASSLITLYCKCHRLTDAGHVFAQLPQKDATVWNSMVAGNFHHHRYQDALRWLSQMQQSGFRPDAHSLAILLKACSNGGLGLQQCEQIHGFLVRNELDRDTFALTGLIHVYSRTGRLCRACKVFEVVLDKTVTIWNSIISGFFYNGLLERSLEFFVLMRSEGFEVRSETASCVLSVCAVLGAGRFGQSVHCCVTILGLELDSYVCTSMIALYGSVGLMEEAYRLFDAVSGKHVQLWNSMLSAFFSNSRASEALDIYDQMRAFGVVPDSISITTSLSSCSMIGQREFGRKVHSLLIKMPHLTTMEVQSSLISMYMRTGAVNEAVILFSSVEEWDIVLLSSMISGFCQNKHYDQALQIFYQLHSEGFIILDSGVFASIISACSALDWLQLGFQIHSLAIKGGNTMYDAFLGSALINMYSKCGLPLAAENIFSATEKKNLVVWNSLISGYSHNGLLNESMEAFVGIVQSGLLPDSISITSVLVSVSTSAALSKGKMIHGYLVRNGVFRDEIVENSLMDMYLKCGCLRYAKLLFDAIPSKNIVAWNTMMAGYGFHGDCSKAIELFQGMQKLNVVPDGTSFLSLICSCSHSGLVKEGRKFYDSMIKDYGIVPKMKHFANMVDLFSRAGRLEEAYRFISEDMPVEPDESIWMCFLSACRVHGFSNLGDIAVEQLLGKPEETGSYVQVFNLYGEMGLMEKSATVRVGMRAAGMRKTPGCSWIEVADKVGVFYSGDLSSPLTIEIHAALISLRRTMKLVEDFKSM